jgi:nitrate reductase gamma subunit
MTTLGKILMIAAYGVYASFWMRFFAHVLVWWRAARRLSASAPTPAPRSRVKACALTGADVFLFGRLLVVNPALWLGEWVFHVSLLLVLLRHLRYFLDPVPAWVWSVQFPGTIAAYVLLISLVYILVVRLLTAMEKYASRANMFLLGLVLIISSIGVVMHAWLTPNLVDVKLFARGFLCFNPEPAPESLLFMTHFILVLVLIPFLPTHIFTAPLVMMEARKREQALHSVIHEK